MIHHMLVPVNRKTITRLTDWKTRQAREEESNGDVDTLGLLFDISDAEEVLTNGL